MLHNAGSVQCVNFSKAFYSCLFFFFLFLFLLKHFSRVWVCLIVKPELYRIRDFSLMNRVIHQLNFFLIVSIEAVSIMYFSGVLVAVLLLKAAQFLCSDLSIAESFFPYSGQIQVGR